MARGFREVKLTQSTVVAAKPEAARYVLADTSIPGFWLVVEPSGRKTFKLRYRVGGGRAGTVREPKIGDASAMKAEMARSIATGWLADVAKGGDPSANRQAKRAAPTMTELFARYMSDHAVPNKRASSVAEDKRLIDLYLTEAFGRMKVEQVARSDVDRFHKGLADRPYLANRCLALLSKAFALSEIWGWRADGSNPCRLIKRFTEEKRSRFLSPDELGRLGEALRTAERDGCLTLPPRPGIREKTDRIPISRWAIAAIRLLALTGARKSEILSLRWDRIDLAAGKAMVSPKEAPTVRGKAAGTKALMLPPAALEVLSRLPRSGDNPHAIQGGKPGAALVNIKDPWIAIREAAGLDGVRVHDLRHSFASVGAAGGASLPIIGALLGHTQPQTTHRYAHLHSDPLQAAAATIGQRISAAMGEVGASCEVVPLHGPRSGEKSRG